MIGITIGDPAGVGPEVTLKAVAEMGPKDRAQTRIFGNLATLQRVADILTLPLRPGVDVASPICRSRVHRSPLVSWTRVEVTRLFASSKLRSRRRWPRRSVAS